MFMAMSIPGALLPLAERRGAQGAAHLFGAAQAGGARTWRGASAVRRKALQGGKYYPRPLLSLIVSQEICILL